MNNFRLALDFRKSILKEFEELKKSKKIGKTTELELIINVPADIDYSMFNFARNFDSEYWETLRELLKISLLTVVYSDIPELTYEILVLKDLGYVECPRCQGYHMAKLNAQVERDGKLSCLCNACTRLILEDSREPEYVKAIEENLKEREMTVEDIP